MKTRVLVYAILLGQLLMSNAMAQIQLGGDIIGATNNEFSGCAVALSGDGTRIVVGALGNSEIEFRSGYVRVFDWDGTGWTKIGSSIYGAQDQGFLGTAVAISADGGRIAVGENNHDGNGNGSGRVLLYDWDGEDWVQVGDAIPGETSGDRSGNAISLSADGSRVAVAALYGDGESAGRGNVRIFELDGNIWRRQGYRIEGQSFGRAFGRSVDLSADGNRVVIGAPSSNSADTYPGYVQVFEWNGFSWDKMGLTIHGEILGSDCGWEVAIDGDGDRIIIGSPGHNTEVEWGGAARMFEWNGDDWEQLGDQIEGQEYYYAMGQEVDISYDGNRIIVGATGYGKAEYSPGYVQAYDWNGTQWMSKGELIEGPEDGIGFSVSLSLAAEGLRMAYGWEKALSWDGLTRIYEYDPVLTSTTEITETLTVFPNPTTGPVFVKGHTGALARLSDQQGRTLWQGIIGAETLDFTRLPVGLYDLQIQTTSGVIRERILKQ